MCKTSSYSRLTW